MFVFSCDDITSNDPVAGADCNIDQCCHPGFNEQNLLNLCYDDFCQDGIIGGYEEISWKRVIFNFYGHYNTSMSNIPTYSSYTSSYIPNYNNLCEKKYRTWLGLSDDGIHTYLLDNEYEIYNSICYDQNGMNYNPDITYEENQTLGYQGHEWIDMLNDGFASADIFDAHCDPEANYDCTANTNWNINGLTGLVDIGHPSAVQIEGVDYSSHDGDGICEASEENCIIVYHDGLLTNGLILSGNIVNSTRLDVPYDRTGDGRGEYSFHENQYGYYNMFGILEKTMHENIICYWITYP